MVRILTLNIGYPDPYGHNQYEKRLESFLECVEDTRPSIMALQEVHWQQYRYLKTLQRAYNIVRLGTCMLFLMGYEVVASGRLDAVSLSDTNISSDIMYVQTRVDGQDVLIYNVYFQPETQSENIKILMDHLRSFRQRGVVKYLLLGDMNMQRRNTLYPLLLTGAYRKDILFKDASTRLNVRFSYHRYSGVRHARAQTGDCQIDYILVGQPADVPPQWRTVRSVAWTEKGSNGTFPSDHFPIISDVELLDLCSCPSDSETDEYETPSDEDAIVYTKGPGAQRVFQFKDDQQVVLFKKRSPENRPSTDGTESGHKKRRCNNKSDNEITRCGDRHIPEVDEEELVEITKAQFQKGKKTKPTEEAEARAGHQPDDLGVLDVMRPSRVPGAFKADYSDVDDLFNHHMTVYNRSLRNEWAQRVFSTNLKEALQQYLTEHQTTLDADYLARLANDVFDHRFGPIDTDTRDEWVHEIKRCNYQSTCAERDHLPSDDDDSLGSLRLSLSPDE
jgi:endonuclease/exonuclease/phosphatase family metal-dependent hydrolase